MHSNGAPSYGLRRTYLLVTDIRICDHASASHCLTNAHLFGYLSLKNGASLGNS